MKTYFQLLDSFLGEVYFRVSKHLGIPISEVIYKRNHLDMIMLMRKYGEIIKEEQRQIQRANREAKKNRSRSKIMVV